MKYRLKGNINWTS